MLQASASLPEVARKPAPWDLTGSGWMVALKAPPGSPSRDAFLPGSLAGQGRGAISYLMYVDYAESACGPYRELLFIPGAFPFADGGRHLTISRILVSTWDSVVNGRLNWGIPKDRADFEVAAAVAGGREDHIRVISDGRELCDLRFASVPFMPSLPVSSALVPERYLTLAQRFEGRDYLYTPQASGRVRPGRLVSWRFDAPLFPDLAAASVLAVFKVERFRMRFPLARISG